MKDCNDTTTCTTNEDCCQVEKSLVEACCPVESTIEMGNKAFFQAMKEVHVESFKEKIKTQWGEKIDQKSDAIVKAMGTHWESILAQGKAQKDLRDEFTKIMFPA